MVRVEIFQRHSDETIYSADVDSANPRPLRAAVTQAVDRNASLAYGYLVCADLESAYLRDADFTRADLSRADLANTNLAGGSLAYASMVGAKLEGANLSAVRAYGVDLQGANLRNANMTGAELVSANLSRANLQGARLAGANLSEADLRHTNISEANLDEIRFDLWSVLDRAPLEVRGLLTRLRAGEIDGSRYHGACACLVGTIASVRGCDYQQLGDLAPDQTRPSERWFLPIRPGHTPENHPVARITEGWITQWMNMRGQVIPARPQALDRDELFTLEVALGLSGAFPMPDTSPGRLRAIVGKLAGSP